MPSPKLNRELAATVLIEAAYTTDEKAATKYGVSARSLKRWRQQLQTDDELALSVTTKKAAFDAAWAEELPSTLKKGIRLLGECADAISEDPRMKKNPLVISTVAGAVKLCAEVLLTSKVIDARIADRDRPANELPEQVPAAETASDYAN